MTALASRSAVTYALDRLREIVAELDGLHSTLLHDGGSRITTFDMSSARKLQRVADLRSWLKLKSNRAALLFLALADAPGEVVTFKTLLLELNILISERSGVSANNRKLVQVYMCDLRHGLAAAGYQDAISTRSKIGYVLTEQSAKSIMQAFDRNLLTPNRSTGTGTLA